MISVVPSRFAPALALLVAFQFTITSAEPELPSLVVQHGQNAMVDVSFRTKTGFRYQLLSSSDLLEWRPSGAAIDGRNDLFTLSFATSTEPREFYRLLIREIPPSIPLRIDSIDARNVAFAFDTIAGRQYHVLASLDLTQWSLWGDLVVANGTHTSFGANPEMTSALFFRVEPVEIIPAPDMVRVPPGTFVMGSPVTEKHRDLDEDPLTTVTFVRGFWMGKYEVTQREYERVMGDNPSKFKGNPDHPVEQVTWKEAMAFCARLTQREQAAGRLPSNYAYRLPTEAEFEYAVRAGTTTRFSFGDDPDYAELPKYAWYKANSDGTSHPVGQKLPNAFGLYDMHGNVWEWCLDWYLTFYPGGNVTHPTGPANGLTRVFRGGGWDYTPQSCRSAYRNYVTPTRRLSYIGFRIVLAPVL